MKFNELPMSALILSTSTKLELKAAFLPFHFIIGMHIQPIKLKDVAKVALYSRLAVFCLQSLAQLLIPIHQNDGFKFRRETDSESFIDRIVHRLFSGFTSWDAQYFLHVTNYGYTHDNTIAFFPLFPLLNRVAASALHLLTFPILAFSSTTVLVGFCLNLYFFVKSAEIIYRLTPHYDHGLQQLSTMAAFLFCFNPASIFFSALYSEGLFAYLTFRLLLALHESKSTEAVVLASLSAVCRSNGLLNFGFVFAFTLYTILLNKQRVEVKLEDIQKMTSISCKCIIGLIPFLSFQAWCYWSLCKTEYVLPEKIPLYCVTGGIQLPYSFIQSANWNVGVFKYFEVKQIPNFILAAPVLVILMSQCYQRLKTNAHYIFTEKKFSCIPSAIVCCHGIFLSLFCFACVHVQVSTRLILSSCPYLYIFMAKSIRRDTFKFRNEHASKLKYSLWIYSWYLMYFVVGSVAFSTGYPWT